MNESKLRFKDDDGSEFPDWEEKSVGDITIELKEYEQLNSGYPLMTSSRIGLMMQEDFRSKSSTEDDTAIFSVVPRGVATYRHMSDDNIFHFNINNLVDKGLYRFIYENGAQNGARHDRVGMTDSLMQDIPVYVPRSLEEQQKIADCLSSLDDVIEKQKATLVAWEEMKKGLLQQMFV